MSEPPTLSNFWRHIDITALLISLAALLSATLLPFIILNREAVSLYDLIDNGKKWSIYALLISLSSYALLTLWRSRAYQVIVKLVVALIALVSLMYSLVDTGGRSSYGFWLTLACVLGLCVYSYVRIGDHYRAFNRPWAFLLIPLSLYSLWVIYPTLSTFYLSFTDWDGFSKLADADFIAFENYVELFVWDDTFKTALLNNLKWILIFITIPTSLGLALALVLNQNVRFERFLKVSYYLPMVLAFVVIGLIWSWIYHPAAGLINSGLAGILGVLKGVGLPVDPEAAKSIGWLADERLAIWAIIGAAVWRQVGYVMILYLAGLKTLDSSILEAAKVDGAEGWTMFRHIIFPLLTPITTIVVVISIIDSLRGFDMVWVMTRGGPFHSSEVLANFMYLEAFHNYNMGYAAAIGVILFLISIVFIGAYIWRVVRDEELQGA